MHINYFEIVIKISYYNISSCRLLFVQDLTITTYSYLTSRMKSSNIQLHGPIKRGITQLVRASSLISSDPEIDFHPRSCEKHDPLLNNTP